MTHLLNDSEAAPNMATSLTPLSIYQRTKKVVRDDNQ